MFLCRINAWMNYMCMYRYIHVHVSEFVYMYMYVYLLEVTREQHVQEDLL